MKSTKAVTQVFFALFCLAAPTGCYPGNPNAYETGTIECSASILYEYGRVLDLVSTAESQTSIHWAQLQVDEFQRDYADVHCRKEDYSYLDANTLVRDWNGTLSGRRAELDDDDPRGARLSSFTKGIEIHGILVSRYSSRYFSLGQSSETAPSNSRNVCELSLTPKGSEDPHYPYPLRFRFHLDGAHLIAQDETGEVGLSCLKLENSSDPWRLRDLDRVFGALALISVARARTSD